MTRKQLNKDDIKNYNERIQQQFGIQEFFSKKDNVEMIDEMFISKEGEKLFFIKETQLIPTLKFLIKKNILKTVIVDMGAVKFVINGADIMRPGIVAFEDGILKDEFVAVVDEKNKKPLCVVKMLFTGEEAKAMSSGKVIKNAHYVGDEV